MKGDRIADDHFVARYCPNSKLSEDGSPAEGAFLLRPAEVGLSVNDITMAEGGHFEEKLRRTKQLMSLNMKLGTNALLAILKVGGIHAAEVEPRFIVEHHPIEVPEVPLEKENKPHCEIMNALTEEQMKAGRTTDVMQLVELCVEARRVGDIG